MADRRMVAEPTAAQVRGDIQAGLTGEKQPGFDPAMAPMETDAEAGGVSTLPGETAIARNEQQAGKRQQFSRDEGTAMRPVFSGNIPPRPGFWIIFATALIGICIGLLTLAYSFRM
jgi:hypothetical protein